MKIFENKNILVTGGTGSIGSVIVEKLIQKYNPNQVRIFDKNEEGLFNATLKYGKSTPARFLIGDIRDKERVSWAMREVDYVFHAAALKHVSLCEYNPFEAIKTNVVGTENVIIAAINHKVKKFINISTDKAAMPVSTMGASKLLSEKITVATNYYKGRVKTVCASVRFGNVLASSGSVIPIFIEQIKKGGPVTITDERMTRYFMTIPKAVELIFKATDISKGGEIFILKMPALKIADLAQVLIEELPSKLKLKSNEIKIKKIGVRPGEKIREYLVTPYEREFTLEMKDMYVIPPLIEFPNLDKNEIPGKVEYYKKLGGKSIDPNKIEKPNLLTKTEIKTILKKEKII